MRSNMELSCQCTLILASKKKASQILRPLLAIILRWESEPKVEVEGFAEVWSMEVHCDFGSCKKF